MSPVPAKAIPIPSCAGIPDIPVRLSMPPRKEPGPERCIAAVSRRFVEWSPIPPGRKDVGASPEKHHAGSDVAAGRAVNPRAFQAGEDKGESQSQGEGNKHRLKADALLQFVHLLDCLHRSEEHTSELQSLRHLVC